MLANKILNIKYVGNVASLIHTGTKAWNPRSVVPSCLGLSETQFENFWLSGLAVDLGVRTEF